jgi:hypothetical protein
MGKVSNDKNLGWFLEEMLRIKYVFLSCRITGDKRWEYENVLEFFKKSEDYKGEWDTRKL